MSGLTDWLRRRGEYPGPGVPAAPAAPTESPGLERVVAAGAAAFIAELETEIAALSRELIAVAHRNAELRRMVEASPEQVRRNCLALSDRLEQAQATIEHLEAQAAQMRREAAVYGVVSP